MKLMQELIALKESADKGMTRAEAANQMHHDFRGRLSLEDCKAIIDAIEDNGDIPSGLESHLAYAFSDKYSTSGREDIAHVMDTLAQDYPVKESAPDAAGINWLSEIQDMLSKKGFSKDEIHEIGEWVAGDVEHDEVDAAILVKIKEKFPGKPLDDLRMTWYRTYMGESLREGAMKDLHVDLLDAIENEFGSNDDMTQAIADYLLDGTDNKKVSEFLYDHFSEGGRMPYGTMKARDGDPDNWIADEMSKIFKKEMGAIWGAEKKPVKEDWGSSDWSAVFNGIERDLKKGVSLEDAIYGMASFYGDSMGYDDIDDAIASIKRVGKARKYDWAMNA